LPKALRDGVLAGVAFQCIAVASGKPLAVSGWNLRGGSSAEGGGPRPLRRAVPVSSVYYGKLANQEEAALLVEMLHFTNALQEVEESLPDWEFRTRQGFGMTLVGTWRGDVPFPDAGEHS
jgi:hypothetical protein